MSVERYRVVGLARPRAAWFADLSQWATSAALPVEFVKCVALEELHARLRSGRVFSAVVLDAGLTGLDRDLVDAARAAGAAVLVVDDGRTRRDWADLGVDAVLPEVIDRSAVLGALTQVAEPIRGPEVEPGTTGVDAPAGWRGRFVAVTGPAGGGSSTMAMAAAEGLARSAAPAGPAAVLLADLALHADQAVLHDVGDVVPGLQELVEAHRTGVPAVDDVRALAFAVDDRGYDVLLGLRRHRDWTVLRRRAVEAALDGIQRAYATVVADVDADVEGDDEVGSVDVEDRNVLARAALPRADLCVVVSSGSVTSLRRLIVTIDDLLRFGVDPRRMLPVVTRAPRRGRARAEIAAAVGALVADLGARGSDLASPVFAPDRRTLDDLVRAGEPLPRAIVTPITDAIEALLDRQPLVPAADDRTDPVAVVPGSLGSWTEREATS